MNQFGSIVTNEKIQLLVMIPVFFGALYVGMRITGAGTGFRGILHSVPRLVTCIIVTVLGAGCLAYMFLSHLEYQFKDPSINRMVVWVTGTYVAFFLYFLMALTATDLLRFFFHRLGHKDLPPGIVMMCTVGIAFLITVFGVIHARDVKTAYYDLSSEGKLSSPLRVVEVSDLHMGSVIGAAHVQRVVDAVNAQDPDLVVFLGDQFNRTNAVDVVDAGAMFKILSQIDAPLGVYAVLGNHDPDLDTEIYQQYLSESNIIALDNGIVEIIPGSEVHQAEVRTLIRASAAGSDSYDVPETPADGSLIMVGRTKLPEDVERVPLAELLNGAGLMHGTDSSSSDTSLTPAAAPAPSDHYLLVLDHDPNGIPEAASCDADLVLAGHTHGGQFFPTTLITQLSYEKGYVYGLAQTPNAATGHITTSIVSSGAGYFQTPIRVGTDSEIVCIDIK